MSTTPAIASFEFSPVNNRRLSNLCGPLNQHLAQLERYFQVHIVQRSNRFQVTGPAKSVRQVESILQRLYHEAGEHEELSAEKVHLYIKESQAAATQNREPQRMTAAPTTPNTRHIPKPRGSHQEQYVESIHTYDMNFGIGPAGTGKTYLAVACAIEALQKEQVRRLIFVRPAVEAGENLGFLPGDLEQKVLPYLRPLYDALYEMLGIERVKKLIDDRVIEIAPLAYMRGRTLNNAFIILDEAQNTTVEQMKMFLTRIGFGSTAVITGDVTQVDLKRGIRSGLVHAIDVLKDVKDISFTYFDSRDAVRHPLVQTIIEAYERHENHDQKPDA